MTARKTERLYQGNITEIIKVGTTNASVTNKRGAFVINVLDNGVKRSVSFNVSANPRLTYTDFVDTFNKIVDTNPCEQVEMPPMEELVKSIASRSPKPVTTIVDGEEVVETEFNNILGHKMRLRSNIRIAFKTLGYEEVKEALTYGLQFLDEVSFEYREEQARTQTAFEMMAKSLYQIHVTTGVCMLENCPNEVVKSRYKLMIKDAKYKAADKVCTDKRYVLNDETWDGNGIPPANMLAWLREDEERNIDDLLV